MTTIAHNIMRLAILSDLHADEPDEKGRIDSLLNVTVPENQVGQHPLASLRRLIEVENLRADVLLCGGDITNKAKPGPLQNAWQWLSKIKDKLGASHLVATVGNHDLDSRHQYNDYDARGMVQASAQGLPVPDQKHVDRFWARHHCITRIGDVSVVVLNTCAYHPEADTERQRGRVSTYTLERLRDDLASAKSAGDLGLAGILLCHHHPTPHPQLTSRPDYQAMVRGPELLELLGSGSFGPWMVIHGHMHIPRLYYASGLASSPVVFAAGAFSARIYDELQGKARNQFYVVDLHLEDINTRGLMGTGRAWDFAPGDGWAPAGSGSGLPQQFGFGNRAVPASVAQDVASIANGQTTKWAKIQEALPEVQFLLPGDFKSMREKLRDQHGLRVLENDGCPIQIGREND